MELNTINSWTNKNVRQTENSFSDITQRYLLSLFNK